MKELGNLAIVCARRPDMLMQICGSEVKVYVRTGTKSKALCSPWDNDAMIRRIIHELNFGEYKQGGIEA